MIEDIEISDSWGLTFTEFRIHLWADDPFWKRIWKVMKLVVRGWA